MGRNCPKCNVTYALDQNGKHNCPIITCRTCKGQYKKREFRLDDEDEHRCILYKEEAKEKDTLWNTELEPTGKVQACLAYDIETRIERIPCPQERIFEFEVDENGRYKKGDNGYVKQYVNAFMKHKVEFVACTDMNTLKYHLWKFDPENPDVDPLYQFIMFATSGYNKGNNRFIAHNARSYDSILLSQYLYNNMKDKKVDLTRRGRKILQMKVKITNCRTETIFLDSMSHMVGSLDKIGKDICPGLLMKGYFPHLFHTVENHEYVGELPDKKFFDITTRAKSQKDVDKFNVWWEEKKLEGGEWSFKQEMEKYLKNDVMMLAKILKVFSDSCIQLFKACPWKCMTGPSYAHKISLRNVTENLFDKYPDLKELSKTDPLEYSSRITQLARNETWAVMKPFEYAPVRAALRGGRTECFQMYAELTKEELENGVRYRYVDITSSYPAQQIRQQYPVGLPELIIYDEDFAPCTDGGCPNSIIRTHCKHTYAGGIWTRTPRGHPFTKRYAPSDQPTAETILNTPWSGYACFTLQPPKMKVMLIGVYDTKAEKLVYTAEKIEKIWLPSCTFLTALKYGYKILKVHAYHKYKMKDSLFRDLTLELFIKKTVNSSNEPEDREALARMYDEKFDTEFGDMIRFSGPWCINPALKMVYKILLNAGWGKHAQQPRLTLTQLMKEKTNNFEMNELMDNVNRGTKIVKDIQNVGDYVRCFTIEDTDFTAPDLHGTYLAAGAMVPAYGQLQLWNEMRKIEDENPGEGRRVVYCDTDSIVYKYYPESYGVYNTVENNDLLGGWTREDPEEKGGIVEFVALGPKTYAYKYADGTCSDIKTKGVTVGYATENIFNFEIMKKHVKLQMKYIHEDKDLNSIRKVGSIGIPQVNFFQNKTSIITHKSIKKIGINIDEMKGVMLETGELVPFGFDTAVDQELILSSWEDYIF